MDSVYSLAQCLGRRFRGPPLSVKDAFDYWRWAVITAMGHGPPDANDSVKRFGVEPGRQCALQKRYGGHAPAAYRSIFPPHQTGMPRWV